MDSSLAKELYSESLQVSNEELGISAPTNGKHSGSCGCNQGNLQDDDDEESFWADGHDELDETADLNREWQKRHNQLHTLGYVDGIDAGKKASAQEGFNIGFRESVVVGYNWGIVRGVTSALACLPDGLKERLVEEQEKRDKFQGLYETMHSFSTTDALKLFRDDIMAKKAEQNGHVETSSNVAVLEKESKDNSGLESYVRELQSLLGSSAIDSRPLLV